MKKIIIYGANGYTGKLIIDRLKQSDCSLTVAGRSAEKIISLAKVYNVSSSIFSIEDVSETTKHLYGYDLLINCAGPFKKTAIPMARAAIAAGCHYMDISGELDCFQKLYDMNEQARNSNVSLIPGIGFDIVPSDCLVALLARKIDKPQSLRLVVVPGDTTPTHGTLKTALGMGNQNILIRKHNHLYAFTGTKVPQKFVIKNKSYWCIRQNLPDLLCAHISSGVENIEAYLSVPKSAQRLVRMQPILQRLSNTKLGEALLYKGIEMLTAGPNEQQIENSRSYIYGEMSNQNSKVFGVLESYEPYIYTADIIVAATKQFLTTGLKKGFQTPSTAFGANFAVDVAPSRISVDYSSDDSDTH